MYLLRCIMSNAWTNDGIYFNQWTKAKVKTTGWGFGAEITTDDEVQSGLGYSTE